MNLHWTSIVIVLFEWLFFSAALWGVAKKLEWEKPWKAWVPALIPGAAEAHKAVLCNEGLSVDLRERTVKDSGKYRIGYVPQKNLIRGKDIVLRTVTDAAALRMPKSVSKEESSSKISEVLDLLGLTAGCESLVEKKSDGQLRRISLPWNW